MATNKPITADTNADNGDCGDFHAIIILGTTTTLTSRNESCNELIEDVDKEYEYFLYEKSPSVFDLVDNANPCGTKQPPDNGRPGNCTTWLSSGATCMPECDAGYRL